MEIRLTTTRTVKNPNTKTTYIVDSIETRTVTREQHRNATSDETLKAFRRLGGTESVTREYTFAGYVVTKIVSTSPDKSIKIIREYEFLL